MNASQRRIARRVVLTQFNIGNTVTKDGGVTATVVGVTNSANRIVVKMKNNRKAEWHVSQSHVVYPMN